MYCGGTMLIFWYWMITIFISHGIYMALQAASSTIMVLQTKTWFYHDIYPINMHLPLFMSNTTWYCHNIGPKTWYYLYFCPQKIWYYHGTCPKNIVLPWYMPKKHGNTFVSVHKIWHYHDTCAKYIVLPWYVAKNMVLPLFLSTKNMVLSW